MTVLSVLQLHAARGKMTIAVRYVEELQCFQGRGTLEEETDPALTFCFFPEDSPLSKLL